MAAREVALVALRVFGHLGLLLAWLGRLLMLLVLVLLVVTLAAGMLASSIQLGQRSAEEATTAELHFAAGVLAVGARHVWVAWHMAPWVAWMAQRTRGESADPAAVVPCAFAAAASAAAASAAAAAVVASAAAWLAVPPWPAVPSQQPALRGAAAPFLGAIAAPVGPVAAAPPPARTSHPPTEGIGAV